MQVENGTSESSEFNLKKNRRRPKNPKSCEAVSYFLGSKVLWKENVAKQFNCRAKSCPTIFNSPLQFLKRCLKKFISQREIYKKLNGQRAQETAIYT